MRRDRAQRETRVRIGRGRPAVLRVERGLHRAVRQGKRRDVQRAVHRCARDREVQVIRIRHSSTRAARLMLKLRDAVSGRCRNGSCPSLEASHPPSATPMASTSAGVPPPNLQLSMILPLEMTWSARKVRASMNFRPRSLRWRRDATQEPVRPESCAACDRTQCSAYRRRREWRGRLLRFPAVHGIPPTPEPGARDPVQLAAAMGRGQPLPRPLCRQRALGLEPCRAARRGRVRGPRAGR